MTGVLAIVAAVVAVTLLGAYAEAQQSKVQMLKEGTVELLFCGVSSVTVPLTSKELTFGQYVSDANVMTIPAGGPFDRQSARCWGAFGNVMDKSQENGFCEVVDQDGDKWYPEFHGNPQGTGGTFTVPYGTGKYAGMTMHAEYRLDLWPRGTGNTVHFCNLNKWSYKLK